MLDANYNQSNCGFADEVISYLYDEIGTRAKTEFEAHLNSCSSCAEEISGFGLVRSAMFEWKDEFAALATPTFVLPVQRHKNPPPIVSIEKHSRFDRLRRIFSSSPIPSAAFALLIICAGMMIFVFTFSGNTKNDDLAAGEFNKNVVPVISPTVEQRIKQTGENEKGKENSPSNPFEARRQKVENSKNAATETAQETAPAAKEPTLKVSTESPKAKADNKSSPNPNPSPKTNTYKENRKSLPARAQNAPKLIDDDETEDDSVRLADLFDEIDTR